MTRIDHYAFAGCGSLTSITIPDGVTRIDPYAFEGCSSLEEVIIAKSVQSIRHSAFSNCGKLRKIIVLGKPKFIDMTITDIEVMLRSNNQAHTDEYLLQCLKCWDRVDKYRNRLLIAAAGRKNEILGYLENLGRQKKPPETLYLVTELQKGKVAITKYNGDEQHVIIPEKINKKTVVSIEKGAFSDTVNIVSITIPNTVTTIGANAFANCPTLESVSLPESITEIGERAFKNCKKLSKIALPREMTVISEDMFAGCLNLLEIVFPASLKSIGWSAFKGCHAIKNIVLPDGLQSIGRDAFANCESLQEVHIPVSVRYIDNGVTSYRPAFPHNENLVVYCDITSAAFSNAIAEEQTVVFTNTEIVEGMVNKRVIDYYMKMKNHTQLEALLPHFKNLDKYIDGYIVQTTEAKDTGLTAFLLNWKHKNVDLDKQRKLEDKRLMRGLASDKPVKATAAELRKLWVVRENNDKTLTICGYKGEDTTIEIPEKIGTKNVTTIGGTQVLVEGHGFHPYFWDGDYRPFGRVSALTQIAIPACVTKFEDGALWGCENATIISTKASAAQKFAQKHKLTFKELQK